MSTNEKKFFTWNTYVNTNLIKKTECSVFRHIPYLDFEHLVKYKGINFNIILTNKIIMVNQKPGSSMMVPLQNYYIFQNKLPGKKKINPRSFLTLLACSSLTQQLEEYNHLC